METFDLGGDKFKIILERETLLVLARCIKEARSKIEDWEFHTLTGGQRPRRTRCGRNS